MIRSRDAFRSISSLVIAALACAAAPSLAAGAGAPEGKGPSDQALARMHADEARDAERDVEEVEKLLEKLEPLHRKQRRQLQKAVDDDPELRKRLDSYEKDFREAAKSRDPRDTGGREADLKRFQAIEAKHRGLKEAIQARAGYEERKVRAEVAEALDLPSPELRPRGLVCEYWYGGICLRWGSTETITRPPATPSEVVVRLRDRSMSSYRSATRCWIDDPVSGGRSQSTAYASSGMGGSNSSSSYCGGTFSIQVPSAAYSYAHFNVEIRTLEWLLDSSSPIWSPDFGFQGYANVRWRLRVYDGNGVQICNEYATRTHSGGWSGGSIDRKEASGSATLACSTPNPTPGSTLTLRVYGTSYASTRGWGLAFGLIEIDDWKTADGSSVRFVP